MKLSIEDIKNLDIKSAQRYVKALNSHLDDTAYFAPDNKLRWQIFFNDITQCLEKLAKLLKVRDIYSDRIKDLSDKNRIAIEALIAARNQACESCASGDPWLDEEMFGYCHDNGEPMGRVRCTAREFVLALKQCEAPPVQRPKIICLCGSTRFYKAFQQANYEQTMAGNIVLTIGFYPQSEEEEKHGQTVGCTPEQKKALDELYFRKVELADEILVLNVDGYVGESTANEIAHAKATGKPIRWLEPPTHEEEIHG